jgi:hypothetical protein
MVLLGLLQKSKVIFNKEVLAMTDKLNELEEAEVNVYDWGSTCGDLKVHCMYDCFGTNDAWLSTDS